MLPLVLLALLAVPRARAEAPRAAEVTLAEALAEAGRSPAQQASLLRTGAAEAGVSAAGAAPPTSVSVGTTYATARVFAMASVPLPVFGTLAADRDVARAELQVARADAQGVALELRRRAAEAWVQLARTEERAGLTGTAAERAEELVRVVHERFAAGDAPHAEEVAADAASARAAAEAEAARASVEAASAELAGVLGRDPSMLLHAVGGLPVPAPPAPLAELRTRAPWQPAVRVTEARAEVEGARVTLAARQRLPELDVNGEVTINDPTQPGNDYRISLGLAVPLFGKRAEVEAAAAARQRAALAEREVALRSAEAAVVAAYGRSRATAVRASSFATKVVPAQREAAALAQAAYAEGQVPLTTVLAANRALLDVESEALEARADAVAARSELDVAAWGGP